VHHKILFIFKLEFNSRLSCLPGKNTQAERVVLFFAQFLKTQQNLDLV